MYSECVEISSAFFLSQKVKFNCYQIFMPCSIYALDKLQMRTSVTCDTPDHEMPYLIF